MDTRHLLVPAAAAVGLLGVFATGYLPSPRSPAEPTSGTPRGALTPQQVLDRAEALVPAVAPRQNGLTITVEPREIPQCSGGPKIYWEAGLARANEPAFFQLIWRGDTGELAYAAAIGRRRPAQPVPVKPLGAREAVEAAGAWMQSLGLFGQAAGWRLNGRPYKAGEMWHVPWRASDRYTIVALSENGGLWIATSGYAVFPQDWKEPRT